MSIVSIEFLLFICGTFIVYYLIKPEYRYIWLLIQSIVFYSCQDIKWIPVMVYVVGVSYVCSVIILKTHGTDFVFFAGVGMTICPLLYFSFFGRSELIGAPIGLSFYTLVAIGYLVDIYKGRCEPEKNIAKLALFISFFPCVLSGPIERSTNLLAQLKTPPLFSYEKTKRGILHILEGIFIKALIADRIAFIVDPAFDNYMEQTGATMVFVIFLFGIQLYADFAGYSYIATGLAAIFGYSIVDNFRQPYFSRSIREFWSRWHISLSNWLKDYIYIPLGGNRCGRLRQCFNLLVTFAISGLWHGKGAHFLIWGLLHGIYQIISILITPLKTRIEEKRLIKSKCFSYRLVEAFVTFCLVDFAWLFFRAPSASVAFAIIKSMCCNFELGVTITDRLYLVGFDPNRVMVLIAEILFWLIIDIIHEKKKSIKVWLDDQNRLFRYSIYIVAVVAVMTGLLYNYGRSATSFIYTRF